MIHSTGLFRGNTLLNEFDRTPAEPEALCARDHRPGGQPTAGEGGRAGLVLQPEAEGEEDDAPADRGRRVPHHGAGQRGGAARHRAGGGAAPRPPGPLPRGRARPAPAPPRGAPPAPDPAGPEPVLAGGRLAARLGPRRAARAAQPAHDVPLAAPPRTALRHPAAT